MKNRLFLTVPRSLPSLLVASLVLTGAVHRVDGAEPGGAFSWRRDAGAVALLSQGHIVWQFNFGTNATKPYFHPVGLVDGLALTADRPSDHPWHRGLWFSWKYLNGVNYWEEDPKTGRAQGRTEWDEPEVETLADFSARISMNVSYVPPGEPPVLKERRVVTVSSPDSEGRYHLDWAATFIAQSKNVLLDRTPLPGEPGGQAWGGYAGLSVRFTTSMEGPQAVAGDGPVTFAGGRYRGKAPAMDYSGVVDQREAGIAILDCSANLNSPSPWYAIAENSFRYFTPAVICYQPYTLKAGQTLSLRYRIIVHPGRWSAERLRTVLMGYAKEPEPVGSR